MSEKDYINNVKAILESRQGSNEKVIKIATLSLPEQANPLIVLIHGDSQQLQWETTYAQENDQDPYSEAEITQLSAEVAEDVIAKINKYLHDWDDENYYNYQFTLSASYGAFVNNTPETEYLDISKKVKARTVHEAVVLAKEWEDRLLERVILHKEQEIGHKLLGVTPHYIIRDMHYLKIASGTLNFESEEGISTWVNQD